MIYLRLNNHVLHCSIILVSFPVSYTNIFALFAFLIQIVQSYQNHDFQLISSVSVGRLRGFNVESLSLSQCWWLAPWTWKYGQNREPLYLTLYLFMTVCIDKHVTSFEEFFYCLTFPTPSLCQWSLRAKPDYCWVQWECDLVPYPLNLCGGNPIGLS